MIRRSSLWMGPVLLLTCLTGYAGGPPILTTSKVPEYFVVGRPETLVFVVRFFGGQPVREKDYRVRARLRGFQKIDVPAIPTGNAGEYAATLTLPVPGEWTIRVDLVKLNVGVWANEDRMSQPLQRKAIWPGSPLPASLSLEERGERNFLEKGCITCHVHRAFVTPKYVTAWYLRPPFTNWIPKLIGPELTDRKFFYDYLVQLLANPSSVRDGARMPNLNLGKDDISALVAFINRERATIASGVPP
jgi:hypothetical protein